jgi:excisionase family DNA binding protein
MELALTSNTSKGNLFSMPTNPEKEFLSTSDVAEWLDVSTATIYKFVEKGDLPVYRLGRINKFRRCDIEEFIQKNKLVGATAIHALKEDNSEEVKG